MPGCDPDKNIEAFGKRGQSYINAQSLEPVKYT
jgi:hypothetical protein